MKLGNFMADSIKGKDYELYSGDMRRGILLHRKIDSFTDSHPIVFQSSHRLFDKFRHYSGVIVDVFYDHFLAKNWKDYHDQDLGEYVQDFYKLLQDNFDRLTPKIQYMYPYMKSQNWLYNYKDIFGIETILFQMSHRIKGRVNLYDSIADLKKYYEEYEEEFSDFFPEIKAYVAEEKKNLAEDNPT